MALTLRAVYSATLELREAGELVTIPALSRKVGVRDTKLESFARSVGGLWEELRIRSHLDFMALSYVSAADHLRQCGEEVNRAALARELDCTMHRVTNALLRHPDWAAYIGVISDAEAKRRGRKKDYIAAAERLVNKRVPRNRNSLATESGHGRRVVYRDFKLDATLWNLLKD